MSQGSNGSSQGMLDSHVNGHEDEVSANLFVNKAGADLGFSRGGGAEFQKKIENFDDLFSRSIKMIF